MEKKVINELLQKYQTPFYLFDIDELKKRVEYLQKKMPSNVKLCYAMKANPFLVKELEGIISKYEVCSPGEYKICENLKIPHKYLVISGVYKDKDSISYMINKDEKIGIYTIESISQIELLDELTKKNKTGVDILLRLTSGNQFGMTEEEIEKILENRASYNNLNIKGIQYFSGTQKNLVKRIEKELNYVDEFLIKLEKEHGYQIEELEFGPGFPVEYFETDKEFNEEEYLNEISNLIAKMHYQGPITMELGRSIAASCGSFFTKVVDAKTNKEGNFAILDGGMHHLVYYGQMMAMKKPKLTIIPERKNENLQDWNLCGSLCTINDLIVKKLPVNNLAIGDVFIFKNTGAYSMTEGISLFLSRDLPQVILKKDNDFEVIREIKNTYPLNMPAERGDK